MDASGEPAQTRAPTHARARSCKGTRLAKYRHTQRIVRDCIRGYPTQRAGSITGLPTLCAEQSQVAGKLTQTEITSDRRHRHACSAKKKKKKKKKEKKANEETIGILSFSTAPSSSPTTTEPRSVRRGRRPLSAGGASERATTMRASADTACHREGTERRATHATGQRRECGPGLKTTTRGGARGVWESRAHTAFTFSGASMAIISGPAWKPRSRRWHRTLFSDSRSSLTGAQAALLAHSTHAQTHTHTQRDARAHVGPRPPAAPGANRGSEGTENEYGTHTRTNTHQHTLP